MDRTAGRTGSAQAAGPRQAARGGTRRRRVLIAALFLTAGLLGGGIAWQQQAASEGPPAYATVPVRLGMVEDTVSALGNIQPRDYVDVGTQVSGQLDKIHVSVGQEVQAGDLLAEIDPTVYRARADANRAQLENLKAQLKEREVRLDLARQLLRRQQNLRRANATSEEALEQAQAEVGITAAQIEALKAQIGQTESQLAADEANLGYTRILAPIKGTIVSITARQGQTLNANQSAPIILRVADLSVMTVWTQVSEADIGRLRVGQEVYFSTLGNPDRRYTSRLRQIMPTPEILNNVVLYNALLDVENPEGRLMTQMTAEVFFVVARAENVPVVPMSAVQASTAGTGGAAGGGTAVLVVRPDGTVERRPVELGVTTRTAAEIRSGVTLGEQVVIGPARPAEAERRQPGGAGPTFRPRLG